MRINGEPARMNEVLAITWFEQQPQVDN